MPPSNTRRGSKAFATAWVTRRPRAVWMAANGWPTGCNCGKCSGRLIAPSTGVHMVIFASMPPVWPRVILQIRCVQSIVGCGVWRSSRRGSHQRANVARYNPARLSKAWGCGAVNSARRLEPIRKPSGTVPILRSTRSKMGPSPSPRRFSDRLLIGRAWHTAFAGHLFAAHRVCQRVRFVRGRR